MLPSRMLCPWENTNRTNFCAQLGGGQMEVTTVNGRQVVACPHCTGTSVCQFRTIVKRIDFDKPLADAAKQHGIAYCLECEKCGRGTKHESPDGLKPPVCKVCSGKGYSIVS